MMTPEEFKYTDQGEALWEAINDAVIPVGNWDETVESIFNIVSPFIPPPFQLKTAIGTHDYPVGSPIDPQNTLLARQRRAELVQLVAARFATFDPESFLKQPDAEEIVREAKICLYAIDKAMKGGSND